MQGSQIGETSLVVMLQHMDVQDILQTIRNALSPGDWHAFLERAADELCMLEEQAKRRESRILKRESRENFV